MRTRIYFGLFEHKCLHVLLCVTARLHSTFYPHASIKDEKFPFIADRASGNNNHSGNECVRLENATVWSELPVV